MLDPLATPSSSCIASLEARSSQQKSSAYLHISFFRSIEMDIPLSYAATSADSSTQEVSAAERALRQAALSQHASRDPTASIPRRSSSSVLDAAAIAFAGLGTAAGAASSGSAVAGPSQEHRPAPQDLQGLAPPPPPSRSCLEHPSVRIQYDLAKATFQAEGIPAAGGACSWAAFSSIFKEIPFPTDDAGASALAERIGRESAACAGSFRRLQRAHTARSDQQSRPRGRGAAREVDLPSYAGGSADEDEPRRAASPAPSTLSVHTVGSSGVKRRRTADAVEDAAATAAVNAQGQFVIDETWPREVKCFLPELGAAVLSGKSLAYAGVRKALCDAFLCDGGDPLSMDAASFSLLTPAFDTMDLAVLEATPKPALEHIRLLQSSIATLHGLTVAARASMKRCFDVYKLACMTKGANWLTVQQLQFRERVDRSQAVFDSVTASSSSFSFIEVLNKAGILRRGLGAVRPSLTHSLTISLSLSLSLSLSHMGNG